MTRRNFNKYKNLKICILEQKAGHGQTAISTVEPKQLRPEDKPTEFRKLTEASLET